MTPEERIAMAVELAARSVEGVYHKQWIIYQMVRVLTGCYLPNGRGSVDSDAYLEWVRLYSAAVGEEMESWDIRIIGIAP